MGKQTEAVLQENLLSQNFMRNYGVWSLKNHQNYLLCVSQEAKEQENKDTTPLLAKPNSN